eukprot:gnl/MRDRNA2_/MRDRNA2_28582_c0_seq1.p1 gnl/MRDRNA2_/MRDRNA2_28582_c0~~gnl/MRDRNA2_/MRDRNA2_28582_c0_seq1.p1  ORF type:complete len:523 (+),score=130.21 gnl/MRDRNA2_/MRDRNA2_28582_c0_seq1:149-1717(+)
MCNFQKCWHYPFKSCRKEIQCRGRGSCEVSVVFLLVFAPVILLAVITEGHPAELFPVKSRSVKQRVAEKLLDRIHEVSHPQHRDLDNMTFAKTHPYIVHGIPVRKPVIHSLRTMPLDIAFPVSMFPVLTRLHVQRSSFPALRSQPDKNSDEYWEDPILGDFGTVNPENYQEYWEKWKSDPANKFNETEYFRQAEEKRRKKDVYNALWGNWKREKELEQQEWIEKKEKQMKEQYDYIRQALEEGRVNDFDEEEYWKQQVPFRDKWNLTNEEKTKWFHEFRDRNHRRRYPFTLGMSRMEFRHIWAEQVGALEQMSKDKEFEKSTGTKVRGIAKGIRETLKSAKTEEEQEEGEFWYPWEWDLPEPEEDEDEEDEDSEDQETTTNAIGVAVAKGKGKVKLKVKMKRKSSGNDNDNAQDMQSLKEQIGLQEEKGQYVDMQVVGTKGNGKVKIKVKMKMKAHDAKEGEDNGMMRGLTNSATKEVQAQLSAREVQDKDVEKDKTQEQHGEVQLNSGKGMGKMKVKVKSS